MNQFKISCASFFVFTMTVLSGTAAHADIFFKNNSKNFIHITRIDRPEFSIAGFQFAECEVVNFSSRVTLCKVSAFISDTGFTNARALHKAIPYLDERDLSLDLELPYILKSEFKPRKNYKIETAHYDNPLKWFRNELDISFVFFDLELNNSFYLENEPIIQYSLSNQQIDCLSNQDEKCKP